MGYKQKKKLCRLTFGEDTGLGGLEVQMRSFTMGRVLQNMTLPTDVNAAAKDPETLGQLIDLFAESIDSWNVEDDDDQPIPPTKENILAFEPDDLMKIVVAWTQSITGVSAPLDARSTSGAPSPEASLPMAPVSRSPGS